MPPARLHRSDQPPAQKLPGSRNGHHHQPHSPSRPAVEQHQVRIKQAPGCRLCGRKKFFRRPHQPPGRRLRHRMARNRKPPWRRQGERHHASIRRRRPGKANPATEATASTIAAGRRSPTSPPGIPAKRPAAPTAGRWLAAGSVAVGVHGNVLALALTTARQQPPIISDQRQPGPAIGAGRSRAMAPITHHQG